MHCIKYGNKTISFKIERSNRRKTVGIHIDPRKGVAVRSPQLLSIGEIEEIVRKKARWITDKQEAVRNDSQLGLFKEFVSGEAFSYLGRQYRLKVIKSASEKNKKCQLINGRLVVTINKHLNGNRIKGAVKNALVRWYLVRAQKKIPERVKLYGKLIGKRPKRIEIKNHKKRWGSCSSDGTIRFNWKIVTSPVTILDYVIVHELCHLIHPHHSNRFWEKVQTILPDYGKRRNRLREYSLQVSILG
ncbi:MAG: hypothetical protein AUJ48_01885 [Deltaproteobacteria bacterium CG1_02_45_11]|nr:MAG: hypothetical protein AUJ48_01885 [Deltaproteobacteria bacterium CG1_02_45_11]